MKILLNLCSIASLACVMALGADGLGLTSFARTENPKPEKLSRVAYTQEVEPFGSHVRSKVVQYFDTYQTDPQGLPEGCAVRTGKAVPAGWTTAGIRRGSVIGAEERQALVDIPAELVRMLPADGSTVRYYLAGSQLVAVGADYKVLDSISIPTVRIGMNESRPGTSNVQVVRHIVVDR